jgi:hypothetical protein
MVRICSYTCTVATEKAGQPTKERYPRHIIRRPLLRFLVRVRRLLAMIWMSMIRRR